MFLGLMGVEVQYHLKHHHLEIKTHCLSPNRTEFLDFVHQQRTIHPFVKKIFYLSWADEQAIVSHSNFEMKLFSQPHLTASKVFLEKPQKLQINGKWMTTRGWRALHFWNSTTWDILWMEFCSYRIQPRSGAFFSLLDPQLESFAVHLSILPLHHAACLIFKNSKWYNPVIGRYYLRIHGPLI